MYFLVFLLFFVCKFIVCKTTWNSFSFFFGTTFPFFLLFAQCHQFLFGIACSCLMPLTFVYYHLLLLGTNCSYSFLFTPTHHAHISNIPLTCLFMLFLLLCANLIIGSLKASSFFYDVKFLGVGLLEWTKSTIQGIFFSLLKCNEYVKY